MSITTHTLTSTHGTRGQGILTRLFAPVVALRQSYLETKRAVAANLLSQDDATLPLLGYSRTDLKAGIVRSVRAE